MENGFQIYELIVWYFVFVASTVLHEAAHAFVALRGGDDTAYRGGQVSIDPWPHIRREPFGMVVVPLLTFYLSSGASLIGWASAPFNLIWARRYPRRQAAMAAAGPAANLILVIFSLVAVKVLLSAGYLDFNRGDGSSWFVPAGPWEGSSWGKILALALYVGLKLNYILLIFNLIPLPPLDGSGILRGLFPASFGRFYDWLRTQPAMSILCLVLSWRIFGAIARPAYDLLARLLVA